MKIRNEKKENCDIGKRSFLMECMKENLNHARHAENERLTFASIYMVLVAGVLTVTINQGSKDKPTTIMMLAGVAMLGDIAICLTCKWNRVFEGHRNCAIACYKQLYKELISADEELNACYPEMTVDAVEKGLALYPFKFHKEPKWYQSARRLFIVFYGVLLFAIVAVAVFVWLKR